MKIDLEPPGSIQQEAGGAYGLSRRLATIGTFLALIWIVWLVNTLVFGGWLVQFGIVPRTLHGLPGILFAPFLHANVSHLSSNSIGILLLGGLLILRRESSFWIVSIVGALASGAGTWVIGRGNAVHLGASGVIFAYFGYLLFAGIFERRIGSLLLSLLVFLVWGGMLWSALPAQGAGAISWEGHLSGLAGGVLAAKLLAQTKPGTPGV